MISKNQMFEELGICAILQGYSFMMDKRIWIDLIIYIRLKEILNEEFK